jgi:serine protease Do
MTPAELYAANLGSCVGITVSTTSTNIFGQTTTSAASGSGFVLTQDGYIVTNYHVIEEAAEDSSVTIEVSFANGDKYDAKLAGGEQDNDVAVLKIEATGLTPVTLGDSSTLVVGESVYAIGNPLGELTYSFTDGIISALDRLITTSSTNDNGQTETTTLNVLQTNCAINPGNSGGPLFDSYGNVVGIVSAKYTQSSSGVSAEGLGFALPINDVKDILADLIEHGYVTGKPYMGVQVSTVSSEAQRYGIPAGAAITYVAEGSCAQKAGLQINDVITAIDDTAIDSPSALTAALSTNYKAGDTATLTVIRSQEELTLTITFDEKNSETEAANQAQQSTQQQTQQNQQDQSQGNYFSQWPFSMFPW